MERPKRIEPSLYEGTGVVGDNFRIKGYNIACKEWEEFLPSREEILEIMNKAKEKHDRLVMICLLFDYIAKVIHNRIHKGGV